MIVVYSKTNCPGCVTLKSKLKLKGIEFEEKNIDTDEEAKNFLIFFGFRTVPQMFKDGQPITIDQL